MKYTIRKYEVKEVDSKRHWYTVGKIKSIEDFIDNVIGKLSEFGGKNNNEQIVAEYTTLGEAEVAFKAYEKPTDDDKKPTITKANVIGNKYDVEFFALVESSETEDERDDLEGWNMLIINSTDDTHIDYLLSLNIDAYEKGDD